MKATFVLTIVLLAAASGTTYYVATTGNDTNPGSFDRPWQHIGRAASTMVAGDSVFVRGGVHFVRAVGRELSEGRGHEVERVE